MIKKRPLIPSITYDLDLYDSIAVAIKILELNQLNELVYVGFNKTAFRTLGGKQSDAIGKTVEQLYPGPIGQIASKHQRDVLRDKEAKTFDVRVAEQMGFGYRRTTLVPTLNDQGKVVRIVSTTLDVTAEKEAIEQRAYSEELVGEIENFTALAAHDLRTPMIHIASVTEMIKRNVSGMDKTQLMAVDMLEGLAEGAMALIMRVLDRYRHVHAKHSEVQNFDLAELCTELYSVLDPFGNHRMVVSEQWVVADKVAVQVVVGNLIDNALKHNAGNSIDVFITARPVMASDMFEITIRDTGKGFDTRLKTTFEQGKLHSSDHFGLSGIRRLIRSRKGSISVANSEGGGGAVISFTFPGQISQRSCPDVESS